jgi:hypothetical protein
VVFRSQSNLLSKGMTVVVVQMGKEVGLFGESPNPSLIEKDIGGLVSLLFGKRLLQVILYAWLNMNLVCVLSINGNEKLGYLITAKVLA